MIKIISWSILMLFMVVVNKPRRNDYGQPTNNNSFTTDTSGWTCLIIIKTKLSVIQILILKRDYASISPLVDIKVKHHQDIDMDKLPDNPIVKAYI